MALKFMISGGGWCVGQWLIPPSTVIDLANPTEKWVMLVKPWFNAGAPGVPPPDAIPLNAETYNKMISYYQPNTVAPVPS